MPKGREMENSPPHTPTMHRTTSVFTFLTSLGFGAIERKKKRSKISALESCYANRIYVLIGVELRPYGQKLVQFCKHTHTRVSFSSIDEARKGDVDYVKVCTS